MLLLFSCSQSFDQLILGVVKRGNHRRFPVHVGLEQDILLHGSLQVPVHLIVVSLQSALIVL